MIDLFCSTKLATTPYWMGLIKLHAVQAQCSALLSTNLGNIKFFPQKFFWVRQDSNWGQLGPLEQTLHLSYAAPGDLIP